MTRTLLAAYIAAVIIIPTWIGLTFPRAEYDDCLRAGLGMVECALR
jgi:hypothetical protein